MEWISKTTLLWVYILNLGARLSQLFVLFPLTSKSGPAEKKSNATAKALEMSLKYSFVTPLTSMVVTKPETEDGPSGPLIADKLTEGRTAGEAGRRTQLSCTPTY